MRPPMAEHDCSTSRGVTRNHGKTPLSEHAYVRSRVTPAGAVEKKPLPLSAEVEVASGRLASYAWMNLVPTCATAGFT